jgi:pyruvate dehydrogenase E2 component (dihydrolipoamide acetyltransferase)
MATIVVMPKQGQSVESCLIVEWKKQPGDPVAEGEILCDVETDKAVMEVPSPAAGTLLATFYPAGELVEVLAPIAAIGAPGEQVDDLAPADATASIPDGPAPGGAASPPAQTQAELPAAEAGNGASSGGEGILKASPRARNLAIHKGVSLDDIPGSGPGGRILERDVEGALQRKPKLSPVAKAKLAEGGYALPDQGSGPGGRIMARDLTSEGEGVEFPVAADAEPDQVAEGEKGARVVQIPVKGVRKVIAQRMLESLQNSAQLTLNSSADARALLAFRQRLKNSDPALDLQGVTLNDLLLFVVARVLHRFPEVNALYQNGTIEQHADVHLGFAVDTPRGLLVPVIRQAERLTLRDLARTGKRLAQAAQGGSIGPDELSGGTFTVSNLGNLGVESFTPILNPPQVAILGVGNVQLKPVEVAGEVQFIPHLHLSLTINHQVVDGAPGARFLQAVAQGLANLDLLLAL